jgi:ribosomal protein L11 methyltransferase
VRAAVLRLRREHLEDALDRLLPAAPHGVYDRELGPFVELTFPEAEVEGAAERELPDDVGARLALLMEPPVVAGRFVIRSPAAPPSGPGLEDIVIDRGRAFGSGLHPTTRRCLELMLALEPGGSFADLGCGTGVLAIAAAKLGWSPVLAVDYDQASVEAAAHNADLNGVELGARRVDLLGEPTPAAETVVANVPLHVQQGVQEALGSVSRHLILSGVNPRAGDTLVEAYARVGLVERRRYVEADWAAILLTPEGVPVGEPAAGAAEPLRVADAGVPLVEAPGDPLPVTLPGQLDTALPSGATALSCSRELVTGARVSVLLAPELFRLDVRHLEDTLKVSLRNLSGKPMRQRADVEPPRTIVTHHDTDIPMPTATNSRMELRIGSGADIRDVELVFTAFNAEHGAVVSAQAVVDPP